MLKKIPLRKKILFLSGTKYISFFISINIFSLFILFNK